MEQRRNKTCDGGGVMCEVTIKESIGRGGNAEIFLGVLGRSGERCVVKKAVRQKAAFMQLSNEAEILEYLNAAGYEHAPSAYFYSGKELAMEYIEGQTLDKLNLMDYSESQLKSLFTDICSAVRKLHEFKGPVIHRDIKPSNIMLDKNRRIILIDFGTAGIVEGYVKVESSGINCKLLSGAGTKRYAAPEQYGGLLEECFATDIYQIGKTIEFLMEGADVSSEFRGEIRDITQKCSAPCAAERYHRVSEVEAELLRVKAREKRHSLIKKITSLKKHKENRGKMSKNAEKPVVFIDIVRTFDTIEFL